MINMNIRKNTRDLLILTIMSGSLLATWSWLLPFDGGPDEIHHYEVVRYIAYHLRWPVFGPHGDLYIRKAPGTRDGMVFGFYALQSTYPYLIPAFILRSLSFLKLDYHAARIGSIIYGIISIIALSSAVSTLFPRHLYLQRMIVALPLLIPQSAYIFAYINQDSFGIMAINLLFCSLICLEYSGKENIKTWLRIGGSWALTAMSRQHVAIFGTLMVFVFFVFSRYRSNMKIWIKLIMTSTIPGFVIFCWALRNYMLYSDPFLQQVARSAWNHWLELVAPHLLHPSFASQGYSLAAFVFLTPWASETFKSFWAKFGYMNIEPPSYIYWVYAIFSAVFVLSFVFYIVKLKNVRLVPFVILSLALLCLHGYKNYVGDFQPQGRYLMIGQPLIFSIFGIGAAHLFLNFENKSGRIAIFDVVFMLSVIHLLVFKSVISRIIGVNLIGE